MWKTVSELLTHALGALPEENPGSGTGAGTGTGTGVGVGTCEGDWRSRLTQSAGETAEQPLDQRRVTCSPSCHSNCGNPRNQHSRHSPSYDSSVSSSGQSSSGSGGSTSMGRASGLLQGWSGSLAGAGEGYEGAAAQERQRQLQLKKLRGFYELAKECLRRGLDADEQGDTAKAGQLYRKFLEIVAEALLVPVGSKSAEAQKIIKELTSLTDTVNARLQDFSRSRNTAATQKKTRNHITTNAPAHFTASAWEASQQQQKQDYPAAGLSSYTGWLGFGTSNRTPNPNTVGATHTVAFPPTHQRATAIQNHNPPTRNQRGPPQPTVPAAGARAAAGRRATGGVPTGSGAGAINAGARHAGGAPAGDVGTGDRRRRGSGCVDPKLVEMIESEIVDRRPIVQWEHIAGLQKAKQALLEMVILPTLRQDLFQGIRQPARGLLLFGPPGNGKTMLARAVASQAKATFFNVSAASLTSKWMGEGEKLMRALFSLAAERQPSVIFIDEIDSILSERSQGEHEASRRLKTEFLVQFDGVLGSDADHVVVMGATNRPEELDEAARRRLVKRIYIPLPDAPARAALLRSLTSTKHTFSISDRDLAHVVELTEGYSGSDLKALCQEAAMAPIRDLGARVASVRAGDVRKVTVTDLTRAMAVIKPSVDSASLKHFEDWARKFGSTS